MTDKVTFAAFLALPKHEKFDEIFTHGNFIGSRAEGKKQVILYALDRFFIELYFDPIVNKIVKVNSFIKGGKFKHPINITLLNFKLFHRTFNFKEWL